MEVFKALIQIFLILMSVNVLLAGLLWRGTGYRPFLLLTLHWIIEIFTFFESGAVAQEAPLFRLLPIILPAFLGVYTLARILADPLQIRMPLSKFIFIPLLAMLAVYLLHLAGVSPEVLALPTVISSSFCFLYVSYQALRHHRKQMTFSMWAIVVIFILYGIHFYDFAYFYTRFELLIIGFTIAMIFHLAVSILVPAVIIEARSREKIRLETRLRFKAKLAQTAKMASLGEMAGGVAHEMNTPLAIVLLSLERMTSLAHGLNKQKTFEALIFQCQETALQMAQIVKSLLAFSTSKPSEAFAKVSLETLIQDTLILCSERMKRNQIEFSMELPQHPIELQARTMQISQVLLNLLSNSFDAVSDMPRKWIRLQVQDRGSFLQFSVTDSGRGPKNEVKERLFQPFLTTKEMGRGAGLGLSISGEVIKAHNGRLYFDESAKQTRFVFTIPKSQEIEHRSNLDSLEGGDLMTAARSSKS